MQFTGRSIQDWVLSLVGVAFTILLVPNPSWRKLLSCWRQGGLGTDDRLYRGRNRVRVGDLVP